MTSHDVPRDPGMHRVDRMTFIFQKPTIAAISTADSTYLAHFFI